jgi:hypothetical protein
MIGNKMLIATSIPRASKGLREWKIVPQRLNIDSDFIKDTKEKGDKKRELLGGHGGI